mgnify:CR=1 FL=1
MQQRREKNMYIERPKMAKNEKGKENLNVIFPKLQRENILKRRAENNQSQMAVNKLVIKLDFNQ